MSSKNYAELAKMLNLGSREIARRVGVSPTTVANVLTGKKGVGLYSQHTEEAIHREIDAHETKVRKYLNRLSGGAVE